MSRLFISHSSENNFETIAIQQWLAEQGWNEIFLDLDAKQGITVGEKWERKIHKAINSCNAILFCVSHDWIKSEWCRKEYELAIKLNKNIVIVLIDGIKRELIPLELKETLQLIDLKSGNDHVGRLIILENKSAEKYVYFSKSGLARLKDGLVKAELHPEYFKWPPEDELNRSPYRGLSALSDIDAGIFFGREGSTADLLKKIKLLRDESKPNFMVILGASGAGKSSFLRAGIIPRLIRDEANFTVIPIVRPEQAAMWGEHGLLQSMINIYEKYNLDLKWTKLKDPLEFNMDEIIERINLLINSSSSNLFNSNEKPTLVIPIDQGEELFQCEGRAEANIFLEFLKHLNNSKELSIIFLITIRTDSFEFLQSSKVLENTMYETFSLSPVPQGAYKNIIEGPAICLKGTEQEFHIEDLLTEKLLKDLEIGESKDCLPLL